MRLRLLFLAGSLLACDADDAPAGPDGVYTTRGRVEGVGRTALAIRHEAIPTFRDREGQVSGMGSMAMRFFYPEGLDLEGIEEGDPVELTFEVHWSVEHTLLITAIDELPAETELELAADH